MDEKGEEWIQREEIAYYLTRVAQVQVARENSILPDEGGPSSGSKKIRRSRYPYVQQRPLSLLFVWQYTMVPNQKKSLRHLLSLLLCLTGLGQPSSVFQLLLYLTVLGNPSRFCYSISSPSTSSILNRLGQPESVLLFNLKSFDFFYT